MLLEVKKSIRINILLYDFLSMFVDGIYFNPVNTKPPYERGFAVSNEPIIVVSAAIFRYSLDILFIL